MIGLVIRNVLRTPRRSLLTLFGVAVAIFVYASLQAAVDGILFPVRQAGDARLLNVREKGRANVLASKLPERLETSLTSVSGVAAATGVLTDIAVVGPQRVHIFVYGVDDATYKAVKGLRVEGADWQSYLGDSQGALVGHLLAEQMGWKKGQTVDLPELSLSFHVAAILPPQGSDLERHLVIHRRYLQTARSGQGKVTFVLVQPAQGSTDSAVARAIDAHQEGTDAPTETASEAAYAQKIVEQFVSFVDYLKVMGVLTIVITLLGAANAVSMNVRERTQEIGILRTVGYTPGRIVGMLVLEAVLVATAGGLVGLGLAAGALGGRGAVLAGLQLTQNTLVVGFAASVAIGVVGALGPAISAVRMTIVDALRVLD